MLEDIRMQLPADWGKWLAALLLLLLVASWLRARIGRALQRWRQRRRLQGAARGERDAGRLLARSGFRVESRQAELDWRILVDGQPRAIRLRADLIVSKGRKRYVAEVKTGQFAPSLDNPATRRQLLEYRLAYPVDGALLVDMERRAVHVVDFGEERLLGRGDRRSRR